MSPAHLLPFHSSARVELPALLLVKTQAFAAEFPLTRASST